MVNVPIRFPGNQISTSDAAGLHKRSRNDVPIDIPCKSMVSCYALLYDDTTLKKKQDKRPGAISKFQLEGYLLCGHGGGAFFKFPTGTWNIRYIIRWTIFSPGDNRVQGQHSVHLSEYSAIFMSYCSICWLLCQFLHPQW